MKPKYIDQNITQTLESNYMPYAMSVIVSRALPEIDGFKPAHRKLLYTMYKMGLLTGARTKSANIVGQTMRLNPHGDGPIYETMVRLSRGNEALNIPFIDSKGNFGKVYSRDMAYAASRYTEAKLDSFCTELFGDIDKDSVDFVPNYDNTMKEPTLLPTSFPNILVNPNLGIAVGMASNICSFNLEEVCRTTIELLKNPDHDILSTLKAPDFSTGAEILWNRAQLEDIYATGRGSIRLRAKWQYLKKENIIEITQIPYTTTVEAIIDKVTELIKAGKIKEINDMRDETGLSGLKIAIDLKRGVDPDQLMLKLMKMTTLMDSFSCNFNVLVAGTPKVMGVREILNEWSAFRIECVRRAMFFDLSRKREKLHLLKGLKKILLDIDKAIKIIRETEEDALVVPNLMIGFGIDKLQAEYVAEIKLRNINKQYILSRIADVDDLEKEIADLEATVNDIKKVKKIIIKQLEHIIKKYPSPRKTEIVLDHEVEVYNEAENIEDYAVNVFVTKEGYFKKITPLSLRMGGEHKLKDGDEIFQSFETTNKTDIIFLTSLGQAYKAKL
ncbi:MAG: topoisomerase IV, partial [Clostridia bacterium]|nr:topoisomerase IV [Clostridia bacterium]